MQYETIPPEEIEALDKMETGEKALYLVSVTLSELFSTADVLDLILDAKPNECPSLLPARLVCVAHLSRLRGVTDSADFVARRASFEHLAVLAPSLEAWYTPLEDSRHFAPSLYRMFVAICGHRLPEDDAP
jgi:hypothetical protein